MGGQLRWFKLVTGYTCDFKVDSLRLKFNFQITSVDQPINRELEIVTGFGNSLHFRVFSNLFLYSSPPLLRRVLLPHL